MPTGQPQVRLTKQDVIDLVQAVKLLEAAYAGINATAAQGKPAILELIDQAHTVVQQLAVKGCAAYFPPPPSDEQAS